MSGPHHAAVLNGVPVCCWGAIVVYTCDTKNPTNSNIKIADIHERESLDVWYGVGEVVLYQSSQLVAYYIVH